MSGAGSPDGDGSGPRERAVGGWALALLVLGAGCLALRWAQASLPGGEERRLVLAGLGAAGLGAGLALALGRRAAARHLVPLLSVGVGVGLALGLFVLADLALGYVAWVGAIGTRPSLDRGLHMRDPLLGWVPRPGTVFRDRFADEFDVEYHVDDEGFRRIPHAGPTAKRIFFFGDSFTFASGVEDHETFTALVARHYVDPRVRVLNAGVIGYGLVQMYARYRSLEQRVQPGDLVVFAPIASDLWRNLDDFFHLSLALYDPSSWDSSFPRFEDGRLQAAPLSTPWNWVRAPFFGARYSKRFFRLLNRALTGPASMAQARDILAAAEALSRERGARFALTFLPDDSVFLKGEYDFDLEPFDYIDLRPYFPSEPDAVRELHHPRDRHWNAGGHRVAARAVVAGLLEAGALEPEALRAGAERLLGAPLDAVRAAPSERG